LRRLLWSLFLAAGLGGCCATLPVASKFFDHQHPEHTLNGFVYAVDTHQWGYAYECLSASSQEKIGLQKFKAILLWYDDPVFEQPIFDIISNAVPNYGAVEGNASAIETSTRAKMLVISTVRDDGERFDYQLTLYFVKDGNGDWRFDFIRSVDGLRQEIEQARS
jgi:hypothetical protein